MNSISTSKLPGRTLENLAIAGSLFLHAMLITIFASWQWDGATAEKASPKVVTVKFIPPPPSAQSTETSNSPKPVSIPPARPLTLQSNSKSHLVARTPSLAIPSLQPVKMARQMIRSDRKTTKRALAQPTFFTKTQLLPAVVPATSPQHSQRSPIHPRPPILEVRASIIPETPAQTAITIEPAKAKTHNIHRRADPTQPMTASHAGFVPQPVTEQSTSRETTTDKFAALPREFAQTTDRQSPDADLNGLRGLFTGKVRQRIANAKYYPRIARRRGMEGQPVIAFTLDKGGRLMEVDLAQTSGYRLLDQAALDAVQQAAPYPEIPASLRLDSFQFKLPISFVLK